MNAIRISLRNPIRLACFNSWLLFLICHGALCDEPNRVSLGESAFEIQLGLTLDKAVSDSLVKWPVVVDWDSDGRLVVVEAGGASKPIIESNKKLLDKIVRLEDTDGDGIFDKRILAADKLPFTEGVLCLGNRILAAAPPYIWELTDDDGDGYCEKREIWFDGQTITGCANDLHGPHLGIDGWIYWCKGAKAEQTHELTDGSQLKDRAAHIFRRRLEGGAIESVISGGMENLVELAFAPTGDRFFTCTFIQLPADGKRDAIGHAVYGAVFGRNHPVIGAKQVVRTGPLMPAAIHLGPAAPSGLICLNDGIQYFTSDSPHTLNSSVLVAAQFNLHRVSAHLLKPDGAGYRTADQVLLESDQVDFHPTDVLEDECGDLLVVDTGGWYDLCCPSSRGNQKVAEGGIYRLRSNESVKTKSPNLEPVNWQDVTPQSCVALLNDPRPWVRTRAVLQIREFGDKALPEIEDALLKLAESKSSMNLVWALSHIGSDAALSTIQRCVLLNIGASVEQRLAACHILGLYRYAPAVDRLKALCRDADLRVVRAAVEALGRIKDSDCIKDIMQVAERAETDAVLRHSLIYALIEIGDNQSLRSYLNDGNDAAEKAIALVALNSIKDTSISSIALNSLHSDQPLLANTALEILKQNPAWSTQADKHLARLSNETAGAENPRFADLALPALLRAWQSTPTVRKFVARQLRREDLSLEYKLDLLSVWQGLMLPGAFDYPLSRLLSLNAEQVGKKLSGLKLSPAKHQRLVSALRDQVDGSVATGDYQKAKVFLNALPSGSEYSNEKIQAYVIQSNSFSLLTKLRIDKSFGQEIVRHLNSVGAKDLPDAVSALSASKHDALDLQLLRRLCDLPAARTLDPGFLTSLYRDRADSLRRAASELDESLHSAPDDVAAVVKDKLTNLPEGNAVRGLKVFRDPKANCAACHKLGHVGGEHGPELTTIGKSRTRESLLESILFPNVRIEQGFRPLKVVTVDGQVFSGLAEREGDIVHLQTNAEKRVSIPEEEIELEKPGEVSIMPTGMREQLTDQELADLLALLKSAK